MEKITAIILAKNEEENISGCIKALSFCDEVIVIDDYSSDKTRKLSLELGASVYKRHLNSNFSKQRNFGLTKAKNDWVLFIDADERVSASLAQEIQELSFDCEGYLVKRNTVFLGKKMKGGEWSGIPLLRLAKKGFGKWSREVHEEWIVNGKTKTLASPLLHYSPTSLSKLLSSMSIYAPAHSSARKKEGKEVYFWQIAVFPIAKFLMNYFVKRAIVDGTHGFVFSVFMSLHSFLSLSIQWSRKNLKLV